jgi:hypothetical protein
MIAKIVSGPNQEKGGQWTDTVLVRHLLFNLKIYQSLSNTSYAL